MKNDCSKVKGDTGNILQGADSNHGVLSNVYIVESMENQIENGKMEENNNYMNTDVLLQRFNVTEKTDSPSLQANALSTLKVGEE